MNQDQKLWVRISHHSNITEQVEVLDLRGAIKSIYDSFVDATNRKVMMNIEISNQPFTTNSLLSRDQQLEQESLSMAITDPDTILYPPNVTLRECNEAWESPEGQAMFKYQRAENRMGVDPDQLALIKRNYELKYPRVAAHGPKWTDT